MSHSKQTKRVFRWQGRNKQGIRLQGLMHSSDKEQVHQSLLTQKIIATQIIEKKIKPSRFTQKITRKDITHFTRQLSVLLSAGVPLSKALAIIQSEKNKKPLCLILNDLKNAVDRGELFSDALMLHAKTFSVLYCQLIKSAEHSGTLETMLQRIAHHLEKTDQLKKKMTKALMYPCIVLASCLTLALLMLLFVVPQFESLFASANTQLPTLTQWLLTLSRWLKHHGIMTALTSFTIMLSMRYCLQRSDQLKASFDTVIMKTWLVGPIIQKGAIARITRTLSTNTQAGIPLLDSLLSSAQTANNTVFKKAIEHSIKQVKLGKPLYQSFEESGLFPHMSIQMMRIGEESGALGCMLEKIANTYEEDIDNTLSTLSNIIEPVIMLFLGLVVGGIVLALYLPIFKMSTAF